VSEVESVSQSCIPYVQIDLSVVLFLRRLLPVESFGLSLSSQYILVRVIPSCFRFAKMCLCQVSLLSRCSLRYLTSSWVSYTLFIWTGEHISPRVVNVTWIDLDSLAFILNFVNQFWIASRLVCSFCEATAGPLSMGHYCRIIGKGCCGRFW
jgi:hypothetical protein